MSDDLEILANKNPQLIYDFYGFDKKLYEVKYPIKNDLNLVDNIVEIFKENNMEIKYNEQREGYDHGVWSILSLIYPDGDIPVVQLSLPDTYDMDKLMELGEILKEFRDQSLILGSGNTTHNLRDIEWHSTDEIKPYAKEFRDWLNKSLEDGDISAIKNMQDIPSFRKNHPTLDHILPLFINIGSSNDKKAQSMIESYMFGNLAMDTFIFEN